MTTMREPILVVNAGSSSIKFSVFETMSDRLLATGVHGEVAGIGTSPRLEMPDPRGGKLADGPVSGTDHAGAIAGIHDWFATHAGDVGFDGVGHRVVQRGANATKPGV